MALAGSVRPARARALCAGHFPGEPLLPGAALVALMAELGGALVTTRQRLTAIERAVFRHRVSPDDVVMVAARIDGRRVHATVVSGGHVAASATLRFEARP